MEVAYGERVIVERVDLDQRFVGHYAVRRDEEGHRSSALGFGHDRRVLDLVFTVQHGRESH